MKSSSQHLVGVEREDEVVAAFVLAEMTLRPKPGQGFSKTLASKERAIATVSSVEAASMMTISAPSGATERRVAPIDPPR